MKTTTKPRKVKITATMIAKDVIKHLKRKNRKIRPMTGVFFEAYSNGLKAGADLMEASKKRTFKCEVCGIGAIFIAAVMRHDDINYRSHLNSREPIHDYLKPWFTKNQLCLIESAFERVRTTDGDYNPALYDACIAAKDWGYRAPSDPGARLIAIMENVIANGGEFHPEKVTA